MEDTVRLRKLTASVTTTSKYIQSEEGVHYNLELIKYFLDQKKYSLNQDLKHSTVFIRFWVLENIILNVHIE